MMRHYAVRYSLLPTRFRPLKTMRRIRFHPVAHGYLFGKPSKKLRVMYARQRRPNRFYTHESARTHNIEKWGTRFGWELGYVIERVKAARELRAARP